MQLKSIKLVGFKSFVDPTVIHIKDGMNGVVGPNGCGKSNIIDAVRWVIGERSAKQLRGQSMSDVIFNGASGRKPVGRASVELCFDNSDGKVVGEYAKFTEIVVKREVFREGQSNYYLNGTNCRRQDIVDIFYGTGLGSRSYAIIEQGMISRLIEAKPEELRNHIEEAAGIAKYKQRRRDTENRMGRTEENLSRLLDIREEIEKQLRHLKRQANAAERYKVLRDEERQLSAELKALQWQVYQQELVQYDQRINEQKTVVERILATKQDAETALEKLRLDQVSATDQHQQAQKDFYGIGAEVARLEQRIHDTESQLERWQRDLSSTEDRWQELSDSTQDYTDQITEIRHEIDQLKPYASEFSEHHQKAESALAAAEQAMQQWNTDWESYQAQLADARRAHEVSQTKQSHQEAMLAQCESQIQRLQNSRQPEQEHVLRDHIQPLENELTMQLSSRTESQRVLEDLSRRIEQQKQTIDQQQHTINEQRHQLQSKEGRLSSLEALQEAAFESNDEAVKQWLEQQHLQSMPRVGQSLQVEPGWEVAVEVVLKGVFEAVGVDRLDTHLNQFTPADSGELMLVESVGLSASQDAVPFESLASRVKSEWPVESWLSSVFMADTLDEAQRMRHQLQPHQSVITREGVWLGKHWMRVSKAVNNDNSVLLREQEVKSLQDDILSLKNSVLGLEEDHRHAKQQLQSLEHQRNDAQAALQTLNDQIAQQQSQLAQKRAQLEALEQKHQSIEQDIQHAERQRGELQHSLADIQSALQASAQSVSQLETKRATFLSQRDSVTQRLNQQREAAQKAKQRLDEYDIRLSSNENQLSVLEQTLQRDQRQLEQLSERRDELHDRLNSSDRPLVQLQSELQSQLSRQSELEQALAQAADHLEGLNAQLANLAQSREQAQVELGELQSAIQQIQMDRQAVQVRQMTITEELQSTELNIDEVIAALPEEASLPVWRERVEALASKITRLGPINLAAIEEHDALLERKTYIDQQHADLQEALDTLQTAIRKIDKETRSQFRETYDKVNTSFQALFPKIFGGGQACIELDGEDLLTAGVVVKAQPPGKRNATIHMLSGGEKALTAIALVFGLFQLNPAPFCILDEVDAPLDDLNVGRYCRLIKEMASQIQFIVISHNKVTIEACDRLSGITMQEPGVSRVVAVDMDEAVSMAEA